MPSTFFPLKTLSVFLLIGPLVMGINSSFAQQDKSPVKCGGPFEGRKIPKQKDIVRVLKQHVLWFKSYSAEKSEGERANFCGAELKGVDLSQAHLPKANLSKAFLVEANLSGAFLRRQWRGWWRCLSKF